jgi:lipoprotein
MDRKLKMRKNVILYMFSMLAVLMGCFFYAPKEVKAAEPQGAQISAQVQTVAYSSDIPEEVKKPIEKGKNLIAYIVAALGFIIFLVGLVMEVVAWFGHQNDMKIQGLIALGAGTLLGSAGIIAAWIMS